MADKPIAESWPDHVRHEDPAREQLPRPPDEPERVPEDTVFERDDLGPGAATLVAAGDPVPPELVDRPRRPASEHYDPDKPRRKR
jgi:hypothetical protein